MWRSDCGHSGRRALGTTERLRIEGQEKMNHSGQEQRGFSLIELLIVVAIILIIAAIAIPNLLRARMAANESSAVASIRTINTAEVTYNSTYPTVGFAPALTNLGGAMGAACVPSSTTACLLDAVLSNNGNPAGSGKSGYLFTTGAGTVAGGVNVGYTARAVPITINQTGLRAFCAEEDAVVRVDPAGVRSEEHTSELQSRVDLVCRLLLEKKKKTTLNLRILEITKLILSTL